MKEKLMVSVAMITYMHEKFITQAIEGVLMQQTNFEFDLIIADDCSPDQTEAIVKNIIKTHPRGHIIKYFRHTRNIGVQRNGLFSLNQCKGKYIAVCEGDDYWTVRDKLQRQIDFMESEKSFTMAFHAVSCENEIDEVKYLYPLPNKEVLKFRDILFTHYIPTCSLVFLNCCLPNPLPTWYNKLKMGDIALELLIADKGKVKYFNEKMSVYRINQSSITRNIEQIRNARQAYIFLYRNLRKHFGIKYYLPITLMIVKNQLGYFKDLLGLNPLLKFK